MGVKQDRILMENINNHNDKYSPSKNDIYSTLSNDKYSTPMKSELKYHTAEHSMLK